MPAFPFLRIYEDSSYKSSSMKSGHNVRFRCSAPLSKTFSQVCTVLTLLDKLEVLNLALNACLSEVVPRTLGLGLPEVF